MRGFMVLVGWSIVLVACAGDDAAGSTEGGSSGVSDSTGQSADDGSTGDGTSPGTGEFELGRLSVQQFITGDAMNESHIVSAFFFTSAPEGSDCTDTSHGPCTVTVCGAGMAADLPPQVSAGDVTISTPTESATLVWNGSQYDGSQSEGHLFAPGEVVSAEVAGTADFPGFMASVTAPGSVTVDSASFVPTIVQSQAYTMDWAATGTGELVFGLATTHTVAGERVERVSFWCVVDITEQTLTVPQAAVAALLPTGSSGCPGDTCDETTAQVTLALSAHTTVDLGDVSARFSLSSPPAHSSGELTPTAWTVEP